MDSPSDSVSGSEDDLQDYALNSEDVEESNSIATELFPAGQKTKLERSTNRKKYSEMVETALYNLNERKGSSRQAVVKYVRANFDVGERAPRYTALALVKLVNDKRILRKSGIGANGKFRLSNEVREEIKTGKKPKKQAKIKGTTKPKTSKSKAAAGEKDEDDESGSDKENVEKPSKKSTKGKTKAKAGTKQPPASKKTKETTSNGTKKPTKAAQTAKQVKNKDTKASKETGSKKTVKPKADKAKESKKNDKENKETTAAKKATKGKSADKKAEEAASKKTTKAPAKANKKKDDKTALKEKNKK